MKKRILTLAIVLIMTISLVPLVSAAADFPFTDVPENHPHRRAIEFCHEYGFVRGINATTFAPQGSLSREQFAIIWARTLRARMHEFTDVQRLPNEMDNAIVLMQALGHINGVSNTYFSRRSTLTREQALTIAYRAYLPGVDGDDSETTFTDHAQISTWARNAVGALQRSGLLANVFSGTTLNPRVAMNRGEICQLIYNIMREPEEPATQHTITIYAGITGGTVTPSKAYAYAGETVTLTVTPDEDMRLVEGSLRYNTTVITGTTFTMPDENVVIRAEFEPVDGNGNGNGNGGYDNGNGEYDNGNGTETPDSIEPHHHRGHHGHEPHNGHNGAHHGNQHHGH